MNRWSAAPVAGVKVTVFAISVAVLLAFVAPVAAQDQAQQKANAEANAFDLNSAIDTSTAGSDVGDGTHGTGALPVTAEDEAEMRRHGRVVKKVRLNKIGLARINAERAKKGLKHLVAGRDLDVAPVDEDMELSAPGGGTPTATSGTATDPAAGVPAATLPSYVNNSTPSTFRRSETRARSVPVRSGPASTTT